MGQIIKIHESLPAFPFPIREDKVRRQISAMGCAYIAHPEHKKIDPSFEAFLERQRNRMRPRLEYSK